MLELTDEVRRRRDTASLERRLVVIGSQLRRRISDLRDFAKKADAGLEATSYEIRLRSQVRSQLYHSEIRLLSEILEMTRLPKKTSKCRCNEC